MLPDIEKRKALEEEVKGLADKILKFMTQECKKNGHSAGACYVAMRMFLHYWIEAIGPETVKKIESQFQIIPSKPTIMSC